MKKPMLRLAPQDIEPTRAEIEMARISQNQREYRSPAGDVSNPKGWQRIDTDARNPLDVDSVLCRYRVVVGSEVGWFRKFLRWIRF